MNKELEALENIKREAGTPYFSSLYDIDVWKEDFATIEKALKRNEPMKVEIKTYTNGFFKRWACSVCDTTVQKEFAYCPYCGQKLDWSDEK